MSERMRKLLKNIRSCGPFWNMMGSGMMAASTVIMTMLVGHLFELEDVGAFSIAMTTAQILYTLALFGANDMQMTDYRHRFQFKQYLSVKLFSTGLTTVICVAAVVVLRFNGIEAVYTFLLTAFMVINSIGELYQSLFFQYNRLDLSGKALFYRYLLSTLVFSIVLVTSHSIVAACGWMILMNLLTTLWWDIVQSNRNLCLIQVHEMQRTRDLFREALPLCASTMSYLFVVNCPRYIINAQLSDEVQGLYTILFMPTYAINLLSQFIFRPYFSRFERLLREDSSGFWRLLIKQITIIMGCAAFLCVVMWLMGPALLQMLFGHNVEAYRGLSGLYVLSGGILAMNQLLYYVMVMIQKQNVILAICLVGGGLTALVGWIVIQKLGVSGGWVSFTAGQAVIMIGYIRGIHRYLKKVSGIG